jgi:hypothetical protein
MKFDFSKPTVEFRSKNAILRGETSFLSPFYRPKSNLSRPVKPSGKPANPPRTRLPDAKPPKTPTSGFVVSYAVFFRFLAVT